MSDFGIKQTRRILICSANDDNTRNYDRVAFIKLIRFYRPRLEYGRAERNYLRKLYENEVIPLLRELNKIGRRNQTPAKVRSCRTRVAYKTLHG